MALTLSGTNKIVNDNLNTEVKTLFTPKNWIINGGFDVWQRGTTQTSDGYGSDDRWNNGNATSTKTNSRQVFTIGQVDVPNNPSHFSRTIVVSGNTSTSLVRKTQRIEDVSKLSGKTVSISFWAKADASKNISIHTLQVFGTGGSTAVTDIGVKKFALTTVWQRFTHTFTIPSISGKVVGVDNFTGFEFWFDAGSSYNSRTDSLGNQSGTFDIANVSLVEGSVPVEWQTEAYADVLRQCRRYTKLFGKVGNAYTIYGTGNIQTGTSGHAYLDIGEMRTIPTSILYGGALVFTEDTVLGTINSILINTNTSSETLLSIDLVLTTALTVGRFAMLRANNDANAYILVSCEL